MKIRFLSVLAGLAIGFAVSALAERNLHADVKTLAEFIALGMKYDEAYNKHDAAALAALFTEDAVVATPQGLFLGRQAIEESYTEVFQQWHPTNYIGQADQLNASGNEAWIVGQWWTTLQIQNGPVFVRGYWSALFVREGDAWKIRMSTSNQTPPQISPAETR
jgi:uncharacterized protein (TIGR02246 family)